MRPANLLFALGPMIVLLGSPAAAQGQAAACFFEHANFQGRRMCFNVGQRVPMVDPSMNDKVSSVQVPPGVQVTICEHANFAGRCVPIDRTVTNLSDVGFNDRVSSVSVEAGRAGPGPGRQQFDGPGRQQFNGPAGRETSVSHPDLRHAAHRWVDRRRARTTTRAARCANCAWTVTTATDGPASGSELQSAAIGSAANAGGRKARNSLPGNADAVALRRASQGAMDAG